jgi:hypothetical protein
MRYTEAIFVIIYSVNYIPFGDYGSISVGTKSTQLGTILRISNECSYIIRATTDSVEVIMAKRLIQDP